MLTVGLIGCGGMGSMHANCYLALKDKVKLVAIADLDKSKAETYAAQAGAKVYETGKELLENEKVDFVDICLPTFLHTEHALIAMEKGFDVFMEKPVCLNEEEAKALTEMQKKTGAKVQIGQVLRFWDQYVWLKEAVASGKFGKVKSGYFFRISENPRWSWNNWFNNPEQSGTVALDLHIHDVDIIRYILGDADDVSADVTRGEDGVIDHIYATYKYGDAVVKAEGCWDSIGQPFEAGYRIYFENATAVYNGGGLVVTTDKGERIVPEFKAECNENVDVGINVSNLGAYYSEIKYFIDEIINGKGEEIAPLQEAIKSAQLVWKEIELAGGRKK